MKNILEDNPVQSSSIRTPAFGTAGADEHVIFVAPFDCFLRSISIASDADSAGSKFKFWKGPSGSAKSIREFPDTALTAHTPLDIGVLDDDNRYIPKGTAVTAKEDTGTADAATPVFTVVYTRA